MNADVFALRVAVGVGDEQFLQGRSARGSLHRCPLLRGSNGMNPQHTLALGIRRFGGMRGLMRVGALTRRDSDAVQALAAACSLVERAFLKP